MIHKNNYIIQRCICLAVSALMIVLLMFFIEPAVADQSSSEIYIDPSSQTVDIGETFTVNIYVAPGEPIMGVAFYLSYDETLVHANSVTEGGLLKDLAWSTMFNPGSIDNDNGIISSVYGLIIGAHTVTSPGIFCTINFTAQTKGGTSTLQLYNFQMTNATGDYVTDLVVSDGNIVLNGSDSQNSNIAPDTPSKPSGASQGLMKISYTYSTVATEPDDGKVYYKWDWGDNTTSMWLGPHISGNTCICPHSWNETGTYDIKVKAKDNYDSESSWSSTLTIEIKNQTQLPENQIENTHPTAIFTYTPTLPTIQDTVEFTDQSTDENGNITKRIWDFGDSNISTQQNPTHQYADNRTYIVTLTVWDDNGSINTTYKQIIISNESETEVPGEISNDETPGLNLFAFLIAITVLVIIKRKNHKC